MAKRSRSWGNLLTSLLLVVPSIFNVARHLITRFEHELRDAKRSLITLFVLALFGLAFFIGFWFCICAIAYVSLHVWFSDLGTLIVLLLSHIVLLLIIGIWMARAKDKLFPNIRELFHN